MTSHLSQHQNFSQKTLCIHRVRKHICDLFNGHHLARFNVLCLNHLSIAALSHLLDKNVVVSHRVLLLKELLSSHIVLRFILRVDFVCHGDSWAAIRLWFVLGKRLVLIALWISKLWTGLRLWRTFLAVFSLHHFTNITLSFGNLLVTIFQNYFIS